MGDKCCPRITVTLDICSLLKLLIGRGKMFITTSSLAQMLALTPHSAHKVLRELERRGLVTKWNSRTYRLEYSQAVAAMMREVCGIRNRPPHHNS